MNNRKIRIHNPMAALPGFTFPGIEAYSTRAMTDCGGLTIIADCHNRKLLEEVGDYYQQLGLGPRELIFVRTSPDGDLYQAIIDDEVISSKVVQLVKQEDYKIEFFCTRDSIEIDFLDQLGLSWSDTISHHPIVADFWNNKANLRLKASTEGLKHLFPEHHIVQNEHELLWAVISILNQYPEVIIKKPLWASGQGMLFGNDVSVVRHFCDHYGVVPGTIVERSLGAEHLPMSIVTQFYDGQVVDQWFTEQQCSLHDEVVSFEGFIIGDLPQATGDDLAWLRTESTKLCDLVLRYNPHLTGILNFDCLRLGKERFVLECNARLTFSSYIQEVRRSLVSSGYPFDNCCLVNRADITGITDFSSLRNKLGDTLFDFSRGQGVIPITIGCLPTSNYCYLLAVSRSYQATLQVMNDAKSKLT